MEHILEAECDLADEFAVEGEDVKVDNLISTSPASELYFSLGWTSAMTLALGKDPRI